ncbi:SAND domain-containing protein [Caerostris extrusa]|uniref:SAND domain-containing protein n=1 Tax=Caerostris extrusa TaxID=172846 RepID=A0AAV4VME5_CAEEX|nr:SAND domain-containing protein [Caerostris extrusa]
MNVPSFAGLLTQKENPDGFISRIAQHLLEFEMFCFWSERGREEAIYPPSRTTPDLFQDYPAVETDVLRFSVEFSAYCESVRSFDIGLSKLHLDAIPQQLTHENEQQDISRPNLRYVLCNPFLHNSAEARVDVSLEDKKLSSTILLSSRSAEPSSTDGNTETGRGRKALPLLTLAILTNVMSYSRALQRRSTDPLIRDMNSSSPKMLCNDCGKRRINGNELKDTPGSQFQPFRHDEDLVLEVECGANIGWMYLSRLCQGSKGASIFFQNVWLTPNEFQSISGRDTAKDWKRSIRHKGKSLKLLMAKGYFDLHSYVCMCKGLSAKTDCAVINRLLGSVQREAFLLRWLGRDGRKE